MKLYLNYFFQVQAPEQLNVNGVHNYMKYADTKLRQAYFNRELNFNKLPEKLSELTIITDVRTGKVLYLGVGFAPKKIVEVVRVYFFDSSDSILFVCVCSLNIVFFFLKML